jgi:hypothetical protein
MPDFAILDTIKFDGEWFLPVAENALPRTVHGNFDWTEKEGLLKLFDAFNPTKSGPITRLAAVPVIHGVTTSAKQITMLQARPAGSRMAMAEAGFKSQDSYRSDRCIVGAHVDEETLYSQIVYRIPGLLLWLGDRGATQSITSPPNSIVTYTFSTDFNERMDFSSKGFAIELRIGRGFSSIDGPIIKIESHAGLKIASNKPESLDWFIREAHKIVALFSVLAGAPMFPDLVKARLEDGRDVNVLVALNSESTCAFTSALDFFLLRGSLGDDFKEVVGKWLSLYEKIESPLGLALGIFSSSDMWLNIEFISLMQALEGLHRALMPGQYMADSEYAKVANTLSAAIPSTVCKDHRDALKAKIKYGSEYSLRKRLKELIDPLPDSIKQLVLGELTVPSKWVDTRNYYTHWDEAGRAEALDGAGMHYAGVRMRLLLRVLYLQQIGVSEQVIVTSLQNGTNDESRRLLQIPKPS